MTRLVVSPRAAQDLTGIWTFSADKWDRRQADAYLRRLQSAFEAIARRPTSGKRCDDIRAGYRRLQCASHVIFYRERHDAVEIVRVLHERMDFSRHVT